MTNLATLIGSKNLGILLSRPESTHVVLIEVNVPVVKEYSNDIDVSKIVCIGTFYRCNQLANYMAKELKKQNISKIGQVSGFPLHADLLQRLRKESFKGNHGDCIVTLEKLTELGGVFGRYKDKTIYNQIVSLYTEFKDCQYIHITFA